MYNFTCRVYWYQSGSPITEVFDAICEFIQKMSKNEFSQLSKVDINCVAFSEQLFCRFHTVLFSFFLGINLFCITSVQNIQQGIVQC